MKAFLFKLSPRALAGYCLVITPLIAHSQAIAALAGVLGVVRNFTDRACFQESI